MISKEEYSGIEEHSCIKASTLYVNNRVANEGLVQYMYGSLILVRARKLDVPINTTPVCSLEEYPVSEEKFHSIGQRQELLYCKIPHVGTTCML